MTHFLSPEIRTRVEEWLSPPFDMETIRKVQHLINHDPKTLSDLFETTISFGTGGMRGLMGIGTSRINRFTVRTATQGLAYYILQQTSTDMPHVFIGYDYRHNSRQFAEDAARVLAANGIAAHITKKPCPTPYVSFGCRCLGCTAAVMITASHNSKEYNGYKVYWEDGAQVVPPHDMGIIEEVRKMKSQREVKLAPFTHPLIQTVEKKVEESYQNALTLLQNHPKENKNLGHILHIVYSSLHGVGITFIPEALKRWGFTNLSLVERQSVPDGSFPLVPSPNPEQSEALKMGSNQLEKEQGDLFIATDPDADRIGVVAYHQGRATLLNGNQIASLCVFYLCHTFNKLNKMPKKGAIITSIVTTDLVSIIASTFHLSCFRVLTGFKYIGEKIREWENGSFSFLFGAEESLGYLYGMHARDKDAISAACLVSEMALQQKMQGKTLVDLLHTIYRQFGLFHEKQLSISFGNSHTEAKHMEAMMADIRSHPPTAINGRDVTTLEDYQTGFKTWAFSEKKEKLTLPKSDILIFSLEDKSKLVIRPSGTEPKVKIYGMVRQCLNEGKEIDEGLKECDRYLDKLLKALIERLS